MAEEAADSPDRADVDEEPELRSPAFDEYRMIDPDTCLDEMLDGEVFL
jgi:hypothetical protein